MTTQGAPVPAAEAAPRAFGGYVTVHAAAPIWRRFVAGILDLLIVAVGASVASGLVRGVAGDALANPGSRTSLLTAAAAQTVLVGGALVYFLRTIAGGATPGMRALGLGVVDRASGGLPRTDQVLLRMAGGVWTLVLLPIAAVTPLLSEPRRSWADHLSGTAVVHGGLRAWYWSWNGEQWVPESPPTDGAVQVTGTRQSMPAPPRSRWTWTDAVPIAVLQLPVAFVGQLAVVRATQAVGIARPETSLGSLILDVVAYGLIAGLIWLFLGLRRKVGLADIGLRPVRLRWLAAALPALLVAYAAEAVAGELGDTFLPRTPPTQCHDIQSAYGSNLALALIGVAVVAPFVEEVLFRGVVFGWMQGRVALPVAVVGSALVFAAAHVLYLQWTLLPPIFAIGCVLALLYHYSRSLWPGIAVHASINTVATLALLLGSVHC